MYSLRLLRLKPLCGRPKLLTSYNANKCVLNQYVNSQYRSALKNSNLARELSKPGVSTSKYNSEKDKLLFVYENPRFFKVLNIFSFVQFIFWVQMSEFLYKKIEDIKVSENAPWWLKINFVNNINRKILASLCFILGYGMLSVIWIYTLRSVRMLVLQKGGQFVSIVTYSPLGKNNILDVPIEKITTNHTRATAKSQLPIKVQGKWFYYMLDTVNGKFPNPELFDYTAGMKRTFKK